MRIPSCHRRIRLPDSMPFHQPCLDRRIDRARVVVDLQAGHPDPRIEAPRLEARRRQLHEGVPLPDSHGIGRRNDTRHVRTRRVLRRQCHEGLHFRVSREAPGPVRPDRAAARVRRSGGSPTCQPPVPALSISTCAVSLASSSSRRIVASAVGDRQMFPRHTKQTRTSMATASVAPCPRFGPLRCTRAPHPLARRETTGRREA